MTSKIVRADGTTVLDSVKSVTYVEKVNADTDLRPGCVASAYIRVEVYGAQEDAPAAGEALTYYQVQNNVETLIGTFYAEPSIPTKTTYAFTAYDAVAKLDVDFSAWLTAHQNDFPMSIYDLVSAACSVAGVTLGSASWPLSTQTVNAFYANVTCRNILQYAAEIACRFVRCDSSGEVIFDWYTTNSTYSIHPSNTQSGYIAYKQDGLEYANYSARVVEAVAIKPSGTDGAAYIYPTTYGAITATDDGDGNIILTNISVSDNSGNLTLSADAEDDGDGNVEISSSAAASNTLILGNNLLLTNATSEVFTATAQNIYTVLLALGAYRPARINLFPFENPFRAGEIISVTDAQGVTFNTVSMGMTVSASAAVIESTGNEVYADESNTQKTLTQLASDIVQIDKLKVGYAEIDELIANWIRTGKITVEDANGTVIFNADAGGNEVEIGQFEVTDEGFVYPSESSGWAIPYKVIITKYGDAAFKSRIVGQELIVMNNSQSPYYASITNGGARYFSGGTAYYNPSNGIITVNGGTLHRSITNSNVYIPDENDSRGAREVGGTEIWKNLVVGDGEFGDRDYPGNMGHIVFTGGLYQMQSRQGVYSPFVFRDVLAEIDSCVKKSGDTMTGNLVINGSTDVGAFLTALTADSGWVDLSPVFYRKVGSTVFVSCHAQYSSALTGQTWTTIATLPDGVRPSRRIDAAGAFGANAEIVGAVRIESSGNIDVYPSAAVSSPYIAFSTSYLV